MSTSNLVELDAATLGGDLASPVVVAPERLESNESRMAKCLVRRDLRGNTVHIHN